MRRIGHTLWIFQRVFGIIRQAPAAFRETVAMRADAKSAEALTYLHVKAEPELGQRLQALVRLERVRSFREMVVYFLETGLAAVCQSSSLRLRPEAKDDVLLSWNLKVDVPAGLYKSFVEQAARFGIKYTDLVRLCLWTGLEVQEGLTRKGKIVTKEVFIEL